MSTWTLKEVRALSEKHGGGNKCCAAKYLSHGDVEKYRPHPGDSLDKYKTFVRMAYEEKQFMAEPEKESDALQEEGEIAEKAEDTHDSSGSQIAYRCPFDNACTFSIRAGVSRSHSTGKRGCGFAMC